MEAFYICLQHIKTYNEEYTQFGFIIKAKNEL